jgi:hypothetical protein
MDRKYEDLIQKLLNKAEKTDSEQEAESLREKIAHLMAKHSIDEAVLSAKRAQEGISESSDEIIRVEIRYTGIYAQALQHWTAYIGQCFSCDTLWDGMSTNNRSNKNTFLYGHRSDVETVQRLVESLRLQLIRPLKALQVEQRDMWFPTTVAAFIERRSFVQGFGSGAAAKINNEKKALAAGSEYGTSTELVLVNRKDAVTRFMRSSTSIRKSSSRGINHGGDGFLRGRSEGMQADTRTGSNRNRIEA